MIGSTTEVLNNGLYNSMVEANNCWRKRGRGRVIGYVLIMITEYNQVENALDLQLRYLQII